MKVSTIRNFIGAAVIGAGAFVMYPPHEKRDIRLKENFPMPISSIECNSNRKNIVIIDNFDTDVVGIDYDLRSDVPHGYIVNRIISKGIPDAKIYNINVPVTEEGAKKSADYSPLKRIIQDIDRGRKYTAINLSAGYLVNYSDLSEQTQMELTPENLKDAKAELKKYLRENMTDDIIARNRTIETKSTMDFINDLDTIASKGTKIYISAGNSHNEAFNLLSLVDSAIVVGAIDENGNKRAYSADNSLVNRWAPDEIKVKKVNGGFNFTNGNDADVEFYETTGIFSAPRYPLILGTSYSTPKALVEDNKKKLDIKY